MAKLRRLPDETLAVVRAAARAPTIDALRMACATLSLDEARSDDISPVADLARAKMLTARFPTIVAAHIRLAAGEEPIEPRGDLPLAADFLHMVFGHPPDPIAARALEQWSRDDSGESSGPCRPAGSDRWALTILKSRLDAAQASAYMFWT